MSFADQKRLHARLCKFVAERFDSMQSNLQFEIDLRSCKLSFDDLGDVEKWEWDGLSFYVWPLPALDGYRLTEFGGRLFLVPEYLPLPIPDDARKVH